MDVLALIFKEYFDNIRIVRDIYITVHTLLTGNELFHRIN